MGTLMSALLAMALTFGAEPEVDIHNLAFLSTCVMWATASLRGMSEAFFDMAVET